MYIHLMVCQKLCQNVVCQGGDHPMPRVTMETWGWDETWHPLVIFFCEVDPIPPNGKTWFPWWEKPVEFDGCSTTFIDIYRYPDSIDTGWWFGTFFIFPFSWEWKNHPNWRTHSIIFQRGRLKAPTRLLSTIINHIPTFIITSYDIPYPNFHMVAGIFPQQIPIRSS